MSEIIPVLPENHIWEIGHDYAAIWEKLPDVTELEEYIPITQFGSDRWVSESVEVVDQGTPDTYLSRMIGRTVRRYDRKKRVFCRDVDWPDTSSSFAELSKVQIQWERSKAISYGFKE